MCNLCLYCCVHVYECVCVRVRACMFVLMRGCITSVRVCVPARFRKSVCVRACVCGRACVCEYVYFLVCSSARVHARVRVCPCTHKRAFYTNVSLITHVGHYLSQNKFAETFFFVDITIKLPRNHTPHIQSSSHNLLFEAMGGGHHPPLRHQGPRARMRTDHGPKGQ